MKHITYVAIYNYIEVLEKMMGVTTMLGMMHCAELVNKIKHGERL